MRNALRPCILACVAAAALACAASPAKRAARAGDYAALRAALADDLGRGKLDRARARDIAEAVGSREILASRPPSSLAPIEDAQSCAHHLSDALETRAGWDDDGGAMAMLVLMDGQAGAWRSPDSKKLVGDFGGSGRPLFRAVAARAAIGSQYGTERRRFFVDPDEKVRLAALRAAMTIADPADRAPLLETTRVDPNPLARSLAIRALGGIGGADTVLALRDRWATADEGLREIIVDAWGSRASGADGGLREILSVAETEHGAPAIEAGLVLLGGRPGEREKAAGLAAVLAGIKDGLERDRKFAISMAPLDYAQLKDAIDRACSAAPPSVRTSACARLSEIPASRTQAIASLQAIAQAGSKEAVFALAQAGDRSVLPKLLPEAASAEKRTRILALRALVDLGEIGRAAQLLADPDALVRMTTACALLLSTRR